MRKLVYILSLVVIFGCASAKAQNYKTHKVKAGETIEQIASKYKVSKSQILALNPDARKKIRPNSVLIIPNATTTTTSTTKEIKTLNGFKKHKVRRKETLYSLSKKYNVAQEDIKKHNPSLYANNLRKGDKIKIPIYTITKEVVEAKPTTKTYTVKPKEGKWRIAYQYGITVPELEDLNPNMAEVLQPGDVINVPNNDSVIAIDEKYSYYTVLKAEGFFRLKLKTGLNQQELEQLNPELVTSGIKEGMVLKIPYKGPDKNGEGFSEVPTEGEPFDLAQNITDRSTKRIAIMLPFKLNKINTDSIYDTKKTIKNDTYTSISLDFYSGVKVALDSLANLGINLKVDVYDTENRSSKVASILRGDFDNVNAVIGPIMPKHFNVAAATLKSKKVPLISPITKTVNLGENVFQSRPAERLLQDKVINHFKADSTSNFVIISDMKNKKRADVLKKAFPEAKLVMSRKTNKKDKPKVDAYYILDDDMLEALKPGKNVVFLETENAGYVSNVSSILNAKINAETKVVLATTNQNKAFEHEDVRNTHLSNLQFTFASIKKSFNEDDSNSFTRRYKNEYRETPNTYAVRGFDITMDVVLRLATSEDLYLSAIESPLTSYVENKFAYKKKLFGGYYNDTVYLIKYDDLKIVEVQQ